MPCGQRRHLRFPGPSIQAEAMQQYHRPSAAGRLPHQAAAIDVQDAGIKIHGHQGLGAAARNKGTMCRSAKRHRRPSNAYTSSKSATTAGMVESIGGEPLAEKVKAALTPRAQDSPVNSIRRPWVKW